MYFLFTNSLFSISVPKLLSLNGRIMAKLPQNGFTGEPKLLDMGHSHTLFRHRGHEDEPILFLHNVHKMTHISLTLPMSCVFRVTFCLSLLLFLLIGNHMKPLDYALLDGIGGSPRSGISVFRRP